MKFGLKRKQSGMHSVELAIVATVFFTLLYGVLEVGRALFIWNLLDEGARRGARLAAVCPVTSTATLQSKAVFGGTYIDGLNTTDATIEVQYLNTNGSEVNPITESGAIRYVRVVISDFEFRPVVQLLDDLHVTAPDFVATLPSESLGVAPFGFTSPSC
ncbi:MAG: TadE/TadG family type IV pilus assembly protein [Motiliproteus sp.]